MTTLLLVGTSDAVDALADRLSRATWRVLVVPDRSSALERAETGGVDCVVSEYDLPEGTGVNLLEAVRIERADLPFIIWTDAGSEAVASEAIAAGVTDYVVREADDADGSGTGRLVDRLEDAIERERRLRELEAKERKFRAVFEEAFDAIMIADDETEYVDVNPAASDLFGLPREDLLGMSIADFADDEYDFDAAWREFQESDADRGTFPLVRADGERRIVEFAATPNILPGRHLSVIRDVTEKRQTKRELDEILGRINDAFYALDTEMRFRYVNERAEEIMQRSEDEVLEESVWDVFPELADGPVWENYHEALETQSPVSFEMYYDAYDLWVETNVYPSETGLSVYFRDVTERVEREQTLRDSERQFRSLIEAAPDPIVVADADTGAVVEANTAAARIRKQPREELLGLDLTDLHAAPDLSDHRTLVAAYLERDERTDQVDDRSRLSLSTVDGEQIPVSISAERLTLGDRTVVHAIFRDVSEQRRYERSLQTLNDAGRELVQAETDTEIAEKTVDVAREVFEASSVAVYRFDDEQGVLSPLSHSTAFESEFGGLPTFGPSDGVVWQSFVEGERVYSDDVRTSSGVYNPGAPIRSELIVPLGEYGVFVLGATDPDALDEVATELVNTLTATTVAALDRAKRAAKLREREWESQLQAQRLEHVNRINDKIRAINSDIVDAETRFEIERAVCTDFVDIDRFAFAWIGEIDLADGKLVPQAWAGRNRDYLDSQSLELTAEPGEPAVQTARTSETTVVSNVADELHGDAWRQSALSRGYRSAIGIPLLHNGVLYGVLTIYSSEPDAFDDLSISVLTELGSLVGYGINAVEQQNALIDGHRTNLTFRIGRSEDTFVDLAAELGTTLEIRNTNSRSDGKTLVHLVVHDTDPDRFHEVVRDSSAVEEARLIQESDTVLYEVVTSGSCIATVSAELGAMSHSIVLEESESRLTMSIPRNRDLRTFVERFQARYPESELIAQHERTNPPRSLSPASTLDRLTDRQREVLEAAYFGGFFEQPRKSTGVEIARSLGISQPSFSKQLRRAERTLLESFYQ